MHCCCTAGDAAQTGGPTHSGAAPPAPSEPPAPSSTGAGSYARRAARRLGTLVQWALPITVLALMPKCPACVGAYILLFTGIGLSFPAAATMRWGLIALSAAALVYLVYRAARRAFAASA